MGKIITIFIAAFLGAIGFIAKKVFIDPILKQKSQITKIQDYLISHANIIANPCNDNIKTGNNISEKLRGLSGELISKTEAIPIYKIFEKVRIVKNRVKINDTAKDIIRLSNNPFKDYHRNELKNSEILKRIGKRLGIQITKF